MTFMEKVLAAFRQDENDPSVFYVKEGFKVTYRSTQITRMRTTVSSGIIIYRDDKRLGSDVNPDLLKFYRVLEKEMV